MCKFGRKFTSALLALALLVSLLPLGAAPAQAEGLTIKINSEKELWDFSYALSQNTPGYANANVSLEGDIDVAISSWVPIGTHEAPAMDPIAFTGTFDGNGYTIKNIHIVDRTYNPTPAGDYRSSADVGLFARLDSGGTVKNLKVTGSVSGGEMGINVGGIVGANNGGIVTNCTFSGSVNGGSAINVGGIVGQNSSSVTDCTFSSGSLSGNGNVGGIVGQNNSSVTDCSNNGGFSISGSGNNFGGVVGNNSGTVENCSNSGSFSVPAPGAGSDTSGGNLGGVVGQNSGAGARITSCYNTGDLLNYTDPHPKVFLTAISAVLLGTTLTTAASQTPTAPATSEATINLSPFRASLAALLVATLATAASQIATTLENSANILTAHSAALLGVTSTPAVSQAATTAATSVAPKVKQSAAL